jgi:hypothetical protein
VLRCTAAAGLLGIGRTEFLVRLEGWGWQKRASEHESRRSTSVRKESSPSTRRSRRWLQAVGHAADLSGFPRMTYLMHACDRSRALPSRIDASVQTTVVWALDPATSLR